MANLLKYSKRHLGKSLMVLPNHVHDLRYSWQGTTEKQEKVIEGWRHGKPIDKYGQAVSHFTSDLLIEWDETTALKITAFRDMVNFIETLKTKLEEDWQEFKKTVPVFDTVKIDEEANNG